MNEVNELLAILRRYFPVFILAFFMAVFSITLAILLNLKLHVPDLARQGLYMVQAACALSVLLCLGNFLIVRGRPWGVWLIVVLLAGCMLAVLPTWGYRTPRPMYFLGLLFPLLGLLLLNSKRHRELRKAMIGVRARRGAQRNK